MQISLFESKSKKNDVTTTVLLPIVVIGIYNRVVITHLASEVVGPIHVIVFHLGHIPGIVHCLPLDEDDDNESQKRKEKRTC